MIDFIEGLQWYKGRLVDQYATQQGESPATFSHAAIPPNKSVKTNASAWEERSDCYRGRTCSRRYLVYVIGG